MLNRVFVLLVAAAALSTAAFGQAKSTWTKYTSPKASFTVLVPCTFEVKSETIKAPSGDIDQTLPPVRRRSGLLHRFVGAVRIGPGGG